MTGLNEPQRREVVSAGRPGHAGHTVLATVTLGLPGFPLRRRGKHPHAELLAFSLGRPCVAAPACVLW